VSDGFPGSIDTNVFVTVQGLPDSDFI